MSKTAYIRVRVTQAEKARLKRAAAKYAVKLGEPVSLSDFLRYAADEVCKMEGE